MTEHGKIVADSLSVSTVVATMVGWLPHLAALFSIAWTVIRIYETRTVQRWLGREPRTRFSDRFGE